MRVLLTVCCLVLVTMPPAAQAPERQADEAAIRDVVRNYLDARDRRDAPAIGALFTADADQHTTSGEWRRGRDAIVPGTLASSQANAGRRRITVETVRFLTADVAIADGPYRSAPPAELPPGACGQPSFWSDRGARGGSAPSGTWCPPPAIEPGPAGGGRGSPSVPRFVYDRIVECRRLNEDDEDTHARRG